MYIVNFFNVDDIVIFWEKYIFFWRNSKFGYSNVKFDIEIMFVK